MTAPVLVLGCGPVGQTTALLLARWGLDVVVLDGRPERDLIGSKAICQQRDVLDVWDAVGVGAEIARRGVTWTTARTFHRDAELFSFTFADRGRSPFPPFVNISQCETEALLDQRIAAEPLIDVRWGHRVTDIEQNETGVTATCADGTRVRGSYAVVCSGARGDDLRAALGLAFEGRAFDDRFLICDIRTDLPGWETERRVYFYPPGDPRRPGLIHPRPRPPRLGDRAAVLLRPRVEPRAPSSHPPLPRFNLPHRLAGPAGLRPGRRGGRRRAEPADPPGDRQPGLRDRVEVGLPVPLPRGRPDAGGPGARRRRRRAPGRAVRRPGPELRRPRRGERRVEGRVRAARLGAGVAAGELPRRAARGGDGEHRRHLGDHALPRPGQRRGGPPP